MVKRHIRTWSSDVCSSDLYKKDLHNQDNHDGVITNLEPDILECEVKWALESITTNKASGGDGIPLELFQIMKDDAVKVLYSICQHLAAQGTLKSLLQHHSSNTSILRRSAFFTVQL